MTDEDMVDHLRSRGYAVRHLGDPHRVLSWHRTEPVPADVDFELEAVEEIRLQVRQEMLQFDRSQLTGTGISILTARLWLFD